MESVGPINLALESGLQFRVEYDLPGVPAVTTDAMPPLGLGHGPDSERLLMASVATCLSASLAFALRKYRNPETPMRTSAQAWLAPNEQGRLRMHSMVVDIHLGVAADSLRFLDRALAQYQDFCTVTASIRRAFPIHVRVFDSDAVLLSGNEQSASQTSSP